MSRCVVRSAMSDDPDFVYARLPAYKGYDNEPDRHDSDMRVRAYVGGALTDVQARLGSTLDATSRTHLEQVLLRCIFTDQVFIRNFEHAELSASIIASLVRSDRRLIELADRARAVSAADLPALLDAIDSQFQYRRAPEPVTS